MSRTAGRARRWSGRLVGAPLVMLLLVAGSAAASSADQEQPVRSACMSSAIRLCPGPALLGDEKGVRSCMLRKLGSATPSCQDAVRELLAQQAAKRATP